MSLTSDRGHQQFNHRKATEDFDNPLDVLFSKSSGPISVWAFGQPSSIRQSEEDNKALVQRQSSIASFHNLSLNDGISVNDS